MANIRKSWKYGRSGYSLKAGIKNSRKAGKNAANRRFRKAKADFSCKSCTYKRVMRFADGYSRVT